MSKSNNHSENLQRLLKNQDDRETLRQQFDNCNFMRAVLRAFIEKEIERTVSEEEASTRYSEPAWSEHQADLIGQRKGMRKILKLLGPPTLSHEEVI